MRKSEANSKSRLCDAIRLGVSTVAGNKLLLFLQLTCVGFVIFTPMLLHTYAQEDAPLTSSLSPPLLSPTPEIGTPSPQFTVELSSMPTFQSTLTSPSTIIYTPTALITLPSLVVPITVSATTNIEPTNITPPALTNTETNTPVVPTDVSATQDSTFANTPTIDSAAVELTVDLEIAPLEYDLTSEVTLTLSEIVETTEDPLLTTMELPVVEQTSTDIAPPTPQILSEPTDSPQSEIPADAEITVEAEVTADAEITVEAEVTADAEITVEAEITPEVEPSSESEVAIDLEATEDAQIPIMTLVSSTAESQKQITTYAFYQVSETGNAGIRISILNGSQVLLDTTETDVSGQFVIEIPTEEFFWYVVDAPLYQRFELGIWPGESLPVVVLAGGDLNEDTCINDEDVALLTFQFDAYTTQANDINHDGISDARDLAILAGNYQLTCDIQPAIMALDTPLETPEPSATTPEAPEETETFEASNTVVPSGLDVVSE